MSRSMLAAVVVCSLVLAVHSFGATPASDDASLVAYAAGWTNTANGGSGWGGGWTLFSSGAGGHWAPGMSTNNGSNGGQDNNLDGDIGEQSWGLWANSGGFADAVRPFDGALSVGQSFTVSFDNGWNNGTVGLGLQNSSDENLVELFHATGNGTYTLNDGAGFNDSLLGWTPEGLILVFTLTSASTYDLDVTRLESGTTSNYTGNLLNPAGGQAATQFRVFNSNAGNGANYDVFVNDMDIGMIPEPGTFALLGLGALAICWRRRV